MLQSTRVRLNLVRDTRRELEQRWSPEERKLPRSSGPLIMHYSFRRGTPLKLRSNAAFIIPIPYTYALFSFFWSFCLFLSPSYFGFSFFALREHIMLDKCSCRVVIYLSIVTIYVVRLYRVRDRRRELEQHFVSCVLRDKILQCGLSFILLYT